MAEGALHHRRAGRIRLYRALWLILCPVIVVAAARAAPPDRAGASGYRALLPLISRPPDFAAVPFGDGFKQVTAITHAGDDRLFVVQRHGLISVLRPDGRSTPFLNIGGRVVWWTGEYGLYDLAFHPQYTQNGFFYVAYTGRDGQGGVSTFISRFRVSADPDAADPASETRLFRLEQTSAIHKGGELAFDPATNLLYAAVGDDRQRRPAQDAAAFQGKIIRLAVDAVPAGAGPDATGLLTLEVRALGLRNPWRFDIDPVRRLLFIGEVGENDWEEINLMSLDETGANFGWPCLEGTAPVAGFENDPLCADPARFRPPIYRYAHDAESCAVIGGRVYRPAWNPADGRFIFGDMCSGEIFALSPAAGGWTAAPLGVLSDGDLMTTFGEDAQGNLYAGTASGFGPVYRLYFR